MQSYFINYVRNTKPATRKASFDHLYQSFLWQRDERPDNGFSTFVALLTIPSIDCRVRSNIELSVYPTLNKLNIEGATVSSCFYLASKPRSACIGVTEKISNLVGCRLSSK